MRALIVGASGGLGSALLEQLVADARCQEIIAWSRSQIRASHQKVTAQRQIDLCHEETIGAAAKDLDEIDLAIVATGLLHDDTMQPEKSFRALDRQTMMRAFEVNTVGPALVAKHVLPRLPRGRRSVLAILSARVGSIADNRLGGWHSYRASKAALNQLIRCFSVELSARQPHAICVGLHPGTVDTGLSKPFRASLQKSRLFSSAEAARNLMAVIDRLTPAQSGLVLDWAGAVIAP